MENKAQNRVNIWVVIVNWNGITDTAACLDSLKKMKTFGSMVGVVVVDNGSTDNSVHVLRTKYPWVEVVENKKNLGFTGGNNAGIRYALDRGAAYVWLLNNDTIVDPNVLLVMKSFRDPAVGIAGSKIYFAPGREFHRARYKASERGRVLWYAGGVIDWRNMFASHRGVDEVDRGQFDKRIDTPFVTGCSMMVRRSVFEKIGLLDDRYFLYLEDLDFCLRAKRAGFRVVYDPSSVLWHVNAGSSGRPGNPLHEYYLTRNRLLVGMRYAPVRTKFALVREAVRMAVTGSPVRRQAIADAVLCRFGNRFPKDQ